VRKECVIGGFIGDKGSGKSLSMTAVIVNALVHSEKVWSNMPVSISKGCARYHGDGINAGLKAEPLDWDKFYMLDESLIEGFLAIDEITYYAGSRYSMESRNRVINLAMRQVRHRRLSVLYTARKFGWIDNYIRDETDFVVGCKDLTYSPWGRERKVPGGTAINQKYFDISGMMTGYSVYQTGWRPYKEVTFCGTPYFDCYDDSDITSIEEAMTGVKMNLRKRVISNSDDHTDNEVILSGLQEYRELRGDRFHTDEFWDFMRTKHGIEGDPKVLGRMIPRQVQRKATHKGFMYDLSNVD